MGTIYKRGNIWWIAYYHKGKQEHETSRSRVKKKAEQLLKSREGDLANGKPLAISFKQVTFQELANDLINDYRINQRKTIKKVEGMIKNHLEPYFGHLPAVDITTSKVDDYIVARLESGASHAVINRELSALKRMFSLATQQTPPKVPQVPYIKRLREDNVREGFFTDEQYQRLLEELPIPLRAPVEFAFWYGWRKTEIIGLTWDKVDLEKGTVRIERGDTKNRQAKQIHLFPQILGLFRKLRNHPDSMKTEYVFHREGQRIINFYGAWRNACKRAGFPEMLFHDLRRTAARNMRGLGLSEKEIMETAGWRTRSVFDRYNIIDDRDQRKVAERLAERAKTLTITK